MQDLTLSSKTAASLADDKQFNALADAQAMAQRDDEDKEVMAMAHSFSRDF